jgi:hypothetical protein
VFALVEEIEDSFAAVTGPREFELLRATLARLADAIDPRGAFGAADEPP